MSTATLFLITRHIEVPEFRNTGPLHAGYRYLVLLKELREMTSPDLFTSRIFIYSCSTVAHGLARVFQSSCLLPIPLPEEKWLPFLRITLQFMCGH